MDRYKQLKSAMMIRNDRAADSALQGNRALVPYIDGLELSAERLLCAIASTDRQILLRSLKPMLDRERRRCRARAEKYDAGRHMGLYIAIKTLNQIEDPGILCRDRVMG